jgi:hypothetical protein
MTGLKAAAAALFVGVVASSGAQAMTYDFTFTGSTYQVSGVFDTAATANGDGTYNMGLRGSEWVDLRA